MKHAHFILIPLFISSFFACDNSENQGKAKKVNKNKVEIESSTHDLTETSTIQEEDTTLQNEVEAYTEQKPTNTPSEPTKKVNVETDIVVNLSTEFGTIDLILYDETPKHKANFIKLAKEGYYNGTTFHRIIDGFMIQGGDPNSKDEDPNNDGQGGPGYTTPAEFVPALKHDYGAIAAARMGDQVNPNKESSGSQFYIVEAKEGTHFLDNGYTVFGRVIKGMDVVEKIAIQPKAPGDRPLKNITITVSTQELSKEKIEKTYNFNYPKFEQ